MCVFLRNTITIIFLSLVSGFTLFAQVPQKFNYQAVVRDAGGQPMVSTSVGMRMSVVQGTPGGTVVYQEIYIPAPVTNQFGLVNLEVGGGLPVSGIFQNINWANGPYYLRIEIDPAGGNSFSVAGESQLLSVPYALFAGNGGGSGDSQHYVGELFGGGVVFYVDETGEHGLICSLIDLETAVAWTDVPTTLIGASAQSSWDGLSNSTAMMAQSVATSTADLCDLYVNVDYGTGVYSDWYLPAIDEVSLIYHAKYQLNKAIDTDGNPATTLLVMNSYWSSTESSSTSAWTYDFVTGSVLGGSKLCALIYVRAVRRF